MNVHSTRRTLFATAAVLSLVVASHAPAFADTTVKVSLWDKGADAPMGSNMGLGMHIDKAMATLGVDIKPNILKAGVVTFRAVNSSREIVHEMVLAPVADPSKPLPYSEADSKVNEDAAGHLGEIAELAPGASGALTITLKPGTYMLYCNIPGHYQAGMWTLLTVKQ